MSKQVIPINMVDQRRMALFSVNENEISFNPQATVGNAMNGLKNGKYEPIKALLIECTKGCLAPNSYWEVCEKLISGMEQWPESNKVNAVREAQHIFLEEILPKVREVGRVELYTNRTLLETNEFGNLIRSKCSIFNECDRVINNNIKLSARFNFDQVIRENDDIFGAEDTIETLCELVDTYKIPVNAKLNTALENILYSYNRSGVGIDKSSAIQTITEYFLRYNDTLSNDQFGKICKVLENNKFISEEDINKVYYLFEEKAPASKKTNLTVEGALSLLESKDFANSEDVKDIIKKYKADQKKDNGKFKTAISHIYTKKPEKVIDDTPNILEFIRNFGILSTLAIHPILTVVIFCVDKYIEIGMKRKEANNVLKHFKAEKVKVETKIDRLKDGDKKDRLEEYSKCLDQSITKLEDYRDGLYTDKELDNIKELEEATNVKYFDKLSIEEYFDNKHGYVRSNVSRAIQLFYNEFLRRFSKPYIEIEEYELFDGEKITTTFSEVDDENLIKFFVTPDGMINMPLFRINYLDPDDTDLTYLFTDITQSCSFVNEFLSGDCIITNYLENDSIYIIFNYLKCLYVEDRDDIDFSLTFEARQEMASILALAEAVEEIEKLYPIDTTKDLVKNIEVLAWDDIDTIVHLVANSNCIYIGSFTDSLKDVQESTTDPILSTDIMMALESLNKLPKKNTRTLIESSLVQAESLKILNAIIQEAKAGTKKPVTAVKNAIKDSMSKGNDKKVSITTNIALASEMLKKKVANLSTKEKEISRNVDINLSVFKKGVEKALTTDRREAIIKGSIIPSFSKTVKAGMVAGALYLVNPVLAAIGVIGALAISKSLTERERQMLLDEIDIELKAVDKEISMAESEGKMREFRHLLTYQRKLQREKQRIKYRLKMSGKDNIPDTEGDN